MAIAIQRLISPIVRERSRIWLSINPSIGRLANPPFAGHQVPKAPGGWARFTTKRDARSPSGTGSRTRRANIAAHPDGLLHLRGLVGARRRRRWIAVPITSAPGSFVRNQG